MNKKINFEIEYFYQGFQAKKFFDFFLDANNYSKSKIMPGIMTIIKPGKNHPVGLGAIRKTKINEKTEIIEKTVGFNYPNYFSYIAISGMPIVDNYQGEVFLKENNKGLKIKYKGNFKAKLFGTNWLIKKIFSIQMKGVLSKWERGYYDYYKIK